MNDFKAKPQLSFSEALKEARGKLTQCTGRSRRSEFWQSYLVICIANILLSWIPFIGNVISLLLFLVLIPLTIRRLHDTGRSGWWCGIGIIGGIIGYAVIFLSIGMDVVTEMMNSTDPEEIAEMISGANLMPIAISGLAGAIYNIIILVFICLDSQPGPNKYGDSPKYVDERTKESTVREWE